MLSRIKFEIEPLVAEMLGRLPVSVWSSDTTTFFDPAIGGGQFVRAVEQRLRDNGHSNANIRSRVFGFEESELHIRFAVNKYKLVGQYARMPYHKLFELDNSMKFDVIVGNFPFTETPGTAREESGNSNNSTLYNDFMEVSFRTAKHINVIIPGGWAKKSTQTTRYLDKGLKSVTFLDAKKVFPDVNIRSGITVVEFESGYTGYVSITTTDRTTYQQTRQDSIQDINPAIKTALSKIDAFGGLNGMVNHGDFEIPKGTKGSIDRLLESSKLYSRDKTNKYNVPVLLYSGGNTREATWAYANYTMASVSGYKVTFPKASDRFILGKVRILSPGQGVSTALYYIKCDTKEDAEKWLIWLEHSIVSYSLKYHKTNDTVNTYNNSMGHIPKCPGLKLTDKNLKKLFEFSDEEYAVIQS